MSVGGAIGGAVGGFLAAGPLGAAAGAVAGGLLFSVLSPKGIKQPVQRIGELAQQTAKEGEPRPIIWGRVRPVAGNIMHSSAPRIVTREVKQQGGGGKGGKKKQPKQYEERVFRTYAIRICEGPITAIIRVWRNNKLVYDARGNEWGAKNNGVFLRIARFYLGGWDQMPDPALESKWGAGDVPAYRGTCYMVVPDEDLTDLGGALPQYVFEVERAEGVALTSLLYSVENIESLDSSGEIAGIRSPLMQANVLPDEMVSVGAFLGISFSAQLIDVSEIELIDSAINISGLSYRRTLNQYTVPVEPLDSSVSISGISNRVALINYTGYTPESINSSASFEAISHARN